MGAVRNRSEVEKEMARDKMGIKGVGTKKLGGATRGGRTTSQN
jgi:hypothetical protein